MVEIPNKSKSIVELLAMPKQGASQGTSAAVRSNQQGLHKGLARAVRRHGASVWRKPARPADEAALARLDQALAGHRGQLILDSFCGTGMSCAILARRHPHALVVGVDRSAHRLARSGPLPDNCLLLRAHCETLWRHLAARSRRVQAHYLLYPNPWPKAAQLSRRIHGHAAFPLLLALGGRLELRSNWPIYVEEFGVALHLLGQAACIAKIADDEAALTRFEAKYRASGHELWRLTATLGGAPARGPWPEAARP